MIIDYNKKEKDSLLRGLLAAKEDAERRHESLIRHQTGTAATLIGLIAVFGDMSQGSILLRCLTISSVLFLLLTVLSGVLYCFLRYRLSVRAALRVLAQYRAGCDSALEATSSPVVSWLGRVFPWLLCLGILLLSASAVCALLFA